MLFRNKFAFRLASLVVLGSALLITNSARAQVVNSGAGSTTSNSQVTLTATVPSIIFVNVNQAQSTLSLSVSSALIGSASNVPSTDFKIAGAVIANSANANVQCSVSTLKLNLSNGSDTITTNLAGTIGGTNISTSGFTPNFSNKQATIAITGDLDESTVTLQKSPGTYSGVLTITATVL